MWPKFFNSKWFERLFTASIAIIGILLTQWIISGRESSATMRKALTDRPTYEYVNQQDKAIMNYVDKQDQDIMTYMKQHTDESEKANQTMMNYIKSMDRKIDILLQRK